MFKIRLTARTAVVALLTVSLLGVASPVVALSEAAPADGVQHEYRLVYATDDDAGQVAIPQPPAGVTYVKWDAIAVGPSPGEMSGALLRSDGKMVGFGQWGPKVIAAIDREFPDAKIVDFTELQRGGRIFHFC